MYVCFLYKTNTLRDPSSANVLSHVWFIILIKSIYEVTDFAETTGAVQ